jgi:hypothetical protein
MLFSNVLSFSQLLAFAIAAPKVLDERSTAANIYYALKDTYQGETFFDMFTFETENDPTHGFVEYVQHAQDNFKLLR